MGWTSISFFLLHDIIILRKEKDNTMCAIELSLASESDALNADLAVPGRTIKAM